MISSPCRRTLSHRYYQMDQGRGGGAHAITLVWSSSVSGCSRLAGSSSTIINRSLPLVIVPTRNRESQPPAHRLQKLHARDTAPRFHVRSLEKHSLHVSTSITKVCDKKWRVIDLMHLSIACPRSPPPPPPREMVGILPGGGQIYPKTPTRGTEKMVKHPHPGEENVRYVCTTRFIESVRGTHTDKIKNWRWSMCPTPGSWNPPYGQIPHPRVKRSGPWIPRGLQGGGGGGVTRGFQSCDGS